MIRASAADQTFDVVVIGSGFGGAAGAQSSTGFHCPAFSA